MEDDTAHSALKVTQSKACFDSKPGDRVLLELVSAADGCLLLGYQISPHSCCLNAQAFSRCYVSQPSRLLFSLVNGLLTLCNAGTYSTGGSFAACTPCGALMTSPEGSASATMCECIAGFGSTAAQPYACVACPVGFYNPDPLNPQAQLQRTVKLATMGVDADVASMSPPDMMPARPSFKPCTPCGPGHSTARTQSTKASDCVADCPCGEGDLSENH